MAKGKQTVMRLVEDVPVFLEGEREPVSILLVGLSNGRVKFDFGSEGEESFEIPIDELIDALIYLDPSGAFARRVLASGKESGG